MKFDQKKLVSSGKATGLALAGFAGAHAASKLAPAQVRRFAPWAMLGLGVILPALVKGDAVASLATGLGSYGALQTVNGIIAPAGSTPTGTMAMVANYVPQLSGVRGIQGLGRVYEYNEKAVPLLGRPQERATTSQSSSNTAKPML